MSTVSRESRRVASKPPLTVRWMTAGLLARQATRRVLPPR